MRGILATILTIAGTLALATLESPNVPPGHPSIKPPLPSGHPTVQSPPTTAPEMGASVSLQSIDSVIDAFYQSISGSDDRPRDWELFRSLFIPGALLISVRTNGSDYAPPSIMTPEQYVKLNAKYFEKSGYRESDVQRVVQQFGGLGQVFSTYESRRAGESEPYARGINGFQLVFDGQRWWIDAVSWQGENAAANPIPPEFLPSAEP